MVFLLGKRLLIWGDPVHHAGVQMTRPKVTRAHDEDPAAARASRVALLEQGWIVAGAHLPAPGIGRIERQGMG
jgi:hypothetical protein